MESSNSTTGLGGFVTVLAVSGSVALVALQLHNSLLSHFFKKLQSDFGSSSSGSCSPRKCGAKKMKKVRFAEDVVEPSSNNEEYRRKRCSSSSLSRVSVS